ncbi:MAG: gldD [Flavipsychrobacter sp.]|jgi:gliding motility-associated lipoprotein GldD|nr:gldD [Flavipsychrobacter sp.]
MSRYIIAFFICSLLWSCRPETYTPRPRGYYEVELPEHNYQKFDNPAYPYSFEYPVYGKVIPDTNFFGEKPENPYWINIDFPSIGGRIYVSYKIIGPDQTLDKLLDDSYEMTIFHTKRADYIDDFVFHDDTNRVHGIFYNVTGNAASAYQFYATDSVRHYIRGALYFDVTPNADSLKPVNEFLRKDMEHLIQTLRWRN